MNAETGQNITIDCKYSAGHISALIFWYIQYPGKSPTYILKSLEDTEQVMEKNKYSARNNLIRQIFPLTVLDVSVSDSGVYFCALLSTTVPQNNILPCHKPV
uniref:Ig-like domain-containing protein n=1 Tax=Pyxicephalus adspersus TaxID=30357 RepID=A0AAV3AEW7_PYXAD|nr:TPA: hypothetical protein GDO54_013708 [Pyxicephalus adspersus]